MDIFYYWKDYEKDIQTPYDTIGRFVSGKYNFQKLNQKRPDYIWAFKTPEKCKPSLKGNLQLVARLVWSETDIVKLPPSKREPVRSTAYYNPWSKNSVIYTNTNSLVAIAHITNLVTNQFPGSVKNNFIGAIESMEDIFLKRFNLEIARYSFSKFWPIRSSVLYKQK